MVAQRLFPNSIYSGENDGDSERKRGRLTGIERRWRKRPVQEETTQESFFPPLKAARFRRALRYGCRMSSPH